jgi:hypothetical protein
VSWKSSLKPRERRLVIAQLLDQLRLVPFMDQHQVCVIQHAIEIECFQVVTSARELRKCFLKLEHRTVSMFAKKVLDAPRVCRFVDLDRIASRQQLRRDTPQEMRVSVVPVGDQRLVEHDYAHAATSRMRRVSRAL